MKRFFIFIVIASLLIIVISCKKENSSDTEIKYDWFPIDYQLPVGKIDMSDSPMKIYYINEKTGFISSVTERNNEPIFVMTNDSSKTFQDLSSQVEGLVLDIDFSSEDCGLLFTMSEFNRFLYKTVDGGKNWQLIQDQNFKNIYTIQTPKDGTFLILSFSGNDSRIMYSSDYGENWSDRINFYGNTVLGGKFQFLGNGQDTGFVYITDTIFTTFDSGFTWDKYTSIECAPLEFYQFADYNTLYIHCLDKFFKSDDLGLTFKYLSDFQVRKWQLISEDEQYILKAVQTYNTSDEFMTINLMNIETVSDDKYEKYILDFMFIKPGIGYAISPTGLIYKTRKK
ncbi:MAG TPA: hypothetical protein VIN10_10680 [Bacteroidales bacterium]